MEIYLDILAVVFSVFATFYFFYIGMKFENEIRVAFFYLSLAILTTITIHSVLSILSQNEILTMFTVMRFMSLQILIGSFILIYAATKLYKGILPNLKK